MTTRTSLCVLGLATAVACSYDASQLAGPLATGSDGPITGIDIAPTGSIDARGPLPVGGAGATDAVDAPIPSGGLGGTIDAISTGGTVTATGGTGLGYDASMAAGASGGGTISTGGATLPATTTSGGTTGSGGATGGTGGNRDAGVSGKDGPISTADVAPACLAQVVANGYACGSATSCAQCEYSGASMEAKCKAVVDCMLAAGGTCSSNCLTECLNQAGASGVVQSCVSQLQTAACGASGCGSIGGTGGSSTTPTGGTGGSLLTGLVAYYKCDSATGTTLPDSSGNGNNGTLVSSGATGYTFSAGMVGNALTLSGAGQGYVSIPPTVFANATDITIATWVYVTTSQNWQNVLDVGINARLANNTSTGTIYMNLVPKNGGTNLAFAITSNGFNNEQTLTTTALPTGAWKHVAVVLTTGRAILYVNGAQVVASTAVTLRPADLGAIDYAFIGKSQFSADPYFDGSIDEIRVYRRALSAAEVAALTVYSGP